MEPDSNASLYSPSLASDLAKNNHGHFYQLMLVTHRQQTSLPSYLNLIKKCAHAGITSVQLREKNSCFNEQLALAKELHNILTPLNIPLIINDNVELALKSNAAGVHLGQKDIAVTTARQLLGPDKIIGVSVNNLAELHQANTQAIDYIGISAIFPSHNKSDIAHFWGLEELSIAASFAKYPLVAIGGINTENAAAVLAAGADGIAAIGVFHDAEQPEITTQCLRQIIEKEK